jgi:hypothetical protein
MIQVLVILDGKVEGYMDKQAFLAKYCPEYILRSEVKETPSTGPVVLPVDPVVVEPVKEPEQASVSDQTANLFEPFVYSLPLQLFSEPVRSIDVSDLPPGLSYDGLTMKIYGTPTKVDSRIITVTGVTHDNVPRLLKATFRLTVTDGASPARPATESNTKTPGNWHYPTTQH